MCGVVYLRQFSLFSDSRCFVHLIIFRSFKPSCRLLKKFVTSEILYNQTILQHSKTPLNFGRIINPTHFATAENPVCGDKIALYVNEQNSILRDVKFTGEGCAICLASASLMTEIIKFKPVKDARELFHLFESYLKMGFPENPGELDLLKAFGVIKKYPIRIKCVLLPWDALMDCFK